MSTDAPLLPDLNTLPDDPTVLKQLVMQLLEALQKANARLEQQEHHVHLLLKRIYGRTSEKFDPRQGVLFDPELGEKEPIPSTPGPSATEAPPTSSPRSKNRDRHGRGRIPDEIEREEVIHDLTDAEKTALGGVENLVELPPETSEQLDWRPSTLFVVVHVRKKYARKEQLPESGLTLAEQNVVVANNEGENSLRGLCVGRRNWLFGGSDRGGRAAAIHFSLLASCKRHGHDPWAYLRDVLTRLPAMLPAASEQELLTLLPHLWKPA